MATTHYSTLRTSVVGDLLLTASDTHLTGIYFLDKDHVPDTSRWTEDAKQPVLKEAAAELADFLKGKRKDFTVPIHFEGTKFQNSVWREIAQVPFGETITYAELARRAGSPSAVRAAGAATGRNPLAIIVPCHRIVGKDGSLTGFAGGLDRKRALLGLECDAIFDRR